MIYRNEFGYDVAKFTAKELRAMTVDELYSAKNMIANLPANPWTNSMYPLNSRTCYKISAEIRKRGGYVPQHREGMMDKYYRMEEGK